MFGEDFARVADVTGRMAASGEQHRMECVCMEYVLGIGPAFATVAPASMVRSAR